MIQFTVLSSPALASFLYHPKLRHFTPIPTLLSYPVL
ncbi:hypothetical protein I593_02080 [Acinetobacter tandoii DSM 14970 = CIP 107469]|uniref:Uncharacterized protein n=1 Tax=Acinetobacter tandoii DSM 14970 = CIP 107469 TaxID=1120927 RepID=R9AYC7_9GAMM|nr:hypothetical protein I593_02080 [Acinetobacter tandoii DSM 14970 = CIP 107469]